MTKEELHKYIEESKYTKDVFIASLKYDEDDPAFQAIVNSLKSNSAYIR